MFRRGLALLLIGLALPAAAEIYKWTDAQGKVHYGDQPPSGIDAKQINSRVSKESEAQALEARRKAAEKAAHRRLEETKASEETARKQATSEEEAKRRAENCQRARGNLELLQRANMRLSKVDAQGQSHNLDAAGREAEMAKAMKSIAANCAN
jgi:hypothetical protein